MFKSSQAVSKWKFQLEPIKIILAHATGRQEGEGNPLFLMDLRPIADPQHDIFMALQSWVEKGVAPEHIVATKYVEDDPSKGKAMSRPVCAYPQQASTIQRAAASTA